MPDELRSFVQQIRTMHEQFRPGLRAELAGVEPGFDLRLEALERGAIVGDWRFQPSPPDGAWVAGHCGVDQTCLPEWKLACHVCGSGKRARLTRHAQLSGATCPA